jgi:hypothetical protein
MLHDNSGPVLIVPRMIIHHAFCLHTSKVVSGVALLLPVAILHARVVGSVNLDLFDRLLYIYARSLQHSPTPTGFAQLIGDGEGGSGDST